MKYFNQLLNKVWFILLMIPGLAFANPYDKISSSFLSGADLFTPPPTDKSIVFLGEIFGTVGGVLHGTSGQLLGKLFETFNYAMVVLSSCILVYTVFMSIINTAQEGEFMGKNMSAAWTAIRAVTGFGILIPKYTGYSLVQVFIIWMTVQGVGLADKAWSQVLTYLTDEGGVIYSNPDRLAGGGLSGMSDTFSDTVVPIFNSQMCLYSLQKAAEDKRALARAKLKDDPTNPLLRDEANMPLPKFRPIFDKQKKTVLFGYESNDPKTASMCGSYIWQGSNKGKDLRTAELFEQYKQTAIENVILSTSGAARSLVVMKAIPKDAQLKIERQRLITSTVGGAIDYENIMQPALRLQKRAATAEWQNGLRKAKNEGWILAGAYYWNLAKINDDLSTIDQDYRPTAKPINIDLLKKDSPEASKLYGNAYNASIEIGKPTKVKEFLSLIRGGTNNGSVVLVVRYIEEGGTPATIQHYLALAATPSLFTQDIQKNAMKTYDLKIAAMTAAAIPGGNFAVAILGHFFAEIRKVAKGWFDIMNVTNGDPISMVQQLGHLLINQALKIWMGTVGLATAGMVGAGICAAFLPFSSMLEAGFKHITPIVLVVVGVLLVNGLVLANYIPLIPFMIFTFSGIGWLISVLEGVVAGPLIAAAITRPEGHDLLGKVEQGLILLMGVFLRPVVMIIGFMAAIILTRVSLRIFNAGFGHVIESAGITDGKNLFGVIALMVIYTTIVISIINMIFTAGVTKLWETIWMWIGFHQQQSTPVQEIMQKAEHTLESGVKSGSDMLQGMGRSSDSMGGQQQASDVKDVKNKVKGRFGHNGQING